MSFLFERGSETYKSFQSKNQNSNLKSEHFDRRPYLALMRCFSSWRRTVLSPQPIPSPYMFMQQVIPSLVILAPYES
jgi:hypothetical protein